MTTATTDPRVQKILKQPFNLVLYHIGGGDGEIGPADRIVRAIPFDTLLVVFEVREQNSSPVEVRTFEKTGQTMLSVNRGVDGAKGRRPFYINKFPLSSSLLKSSPLAKAEDPQFPMFHTWGENTELDREISVEVSSLDAIIKELDLPPPDFLSIDAQGAEFSILKGAERAFQESIVGAVSEVEFSEIYSGQGLFDDQMRWYSEHGLRLVQIYNQQQWHPGPRMPGEAFLTVGEALFVKYVHEFHESEVLPARGFIDLSKMSGMQLLKLIAVARAFSMISYASKLAEFVILARPEVCAIAEDQPVLAESLNIARYAMKNHENYRAKKNFFLKNMNAI